MDYIYDHAELDLVTLAAKDALSVTGKIDGAMEMGFRVIETEIWIDIRDKPVNTGGIIVGMAVDLNSAEIEATIEADPQSSAPSQMANRSLTAQPVFPLGLISHDATFGTVFYDHSRGGGPFKMAPRGWSIPEGSKLNFWAYCLDTTLTGNTMCTFFAKHKGVWLRD